MNYHSNMTVSELIRAGSNGDKCALLELGVRACDFKICQDEVFCEHQIELEELNFALENESSVEDCPHCGKFISDI